MSDPCWTGHFMKNNNVITAEQPGKNVSSLGLKMLRDLGAHTTLVEKESKAKYVDCELRQSNQHFLWHP